MKNFYLIIKNGFQNVEGKILKYLDYKYLNNTLVYFKDNNVDFINGKLNLTNKEINELKKELQLNNKQLLYFSINKNNQVKQLKNFK